MKEKDPYGEFLRSVRCFLPQERVYTDLIRRFAWGTDASFYRLVPRIVIRSESEEEVAQILAEAHAWRLPVTFRAAGTSLSGQALSDSILIVAGKNWEKSTYHSDTTVTLQPGIVGAEVNRRLAPHGRKFGPDPASIGSAMVGGIVMNNASGMSCGTHANSDRCLVSARLVLPDGTVLDTGSAASRSAFRQRHPELLSGIEKLRDEIRADAALSERIRYKYSIKNVTGLNLLPFITYSDPFDIVAHLLVGSEGTLAFLSEVRMTTLPVAPFKASAMIYFPSIRMAAEAVVALRKERITAAELLDIRSLIAVNDPHLDGYGLKGRAFRRDPAVPAQNDPAAEENPMVRESRFRPFPAASRPEEMGLIDLSDLTAVLTQTEAQTHEEMLAQIARIQAVLEPFGVDVDFSEDPAVTAGYWAIRAGIFPAVGGLRKEGTTCLIEDVAFHIEDLPAATEDLSALLDRHGYDDSCIYGHALEGNFHFIINQSFATEADVRRYEAMIRDVAEMVVGKYDGSLKAEHGTGRNMAPFVRLEWGDKAFSVMQRVKALFDPDGILNPGVIFNDDPECFIKDFKALPVLRPDLPAGSAASEAAGRPDDAVREAYRQLNKCIECGFCEVNCVSCGFTLSSRTRIAVRREIARLRSDEPIDGMDPATRKRWLEELERGYRYYGDETCAADGLCSTSCPMGINVADLTHELRRERLSAAGRALGTFTAHHFHSAKTAIRGALRLASLGQAVLGTGGMATLGSALHKGLALPLWTPATPRAYNASRALSSGKTAPCEDGRQESRTEGSPRKVVYFPSCLNQMMGLPADPKLRSPRPRTEPQTPSPVTGPRPLAGLLPRRPLAEETVALLHKAGYEVIFPEHMDSLCCGMIWESKGMPETANRKTAELEAALWKASEGGKYPVLCDQSPCLHRMRAKIQRMKLYEPVEFIHDFLMDRLIFRPTGETVAVHITCSTRLMGLGDKLVALARRCASQVIVPDGVGCCGFAGDKGMTRPELNAYALRKLRAKVNPAAAPETSAAPNPAAAPENATAPENAAASSAPATPAAAGYSNSRTCETGLTTHSGIPYQSIVYLVNACTEPEDQSSITGRMR